MFKLNHEPTCNESSMEIIKHQCETILQYANLYQYKTVI